MSVKIRLKRMGSKKRPFYRFIAADSRMPRDGRFLETVGYYNPMTTPADIHVDEEALFKWLGNGATPTVNAASLLRQVGSLQKWDLVKAGVTGEELEAKVEAIKNQRIATVQRKDMAKSGEKSKKALAKEAAQTEADAAKAAEEAEAAKAAEAKAAEEKAAEAAPAEAAAEPEAAPAPDAKEGADSAEPKKDAE